MDDHIYKIIQLAGSSTESIEKAIENAVSRASQTLHDLRWFEVVETRGHIEGGRVNHYQVVVKVGFSLEDRPAD
ncbi:MAG: dodecin [Kiloniellales bacterium]|nr:dodecin [Kiloniellales bacterium]